MDGYIQICIYYIKHASGVVVVGLRQLRQLRNVGVFGSKGGGLHPLDHFLYVGIVWWKGGAEERRGGGE